MSKEINNEMVKYLEEKLNKLQEIKIDCVTDIDLMSIIMQQNVIYDIINQAGYYYDTSMITGKIFIYK